VRITLVEPRSPGFHVFSRVKLPRLGLPLIGTLLRNQGHDVKVYVEDISSIDTDRLLSSDLVGISTTTSTAPRAYEYADMVKRRSPQTRVMMGGPHVTFLPGEALEHADFCVRREGEWTSTQLVRALEKEEGFHQIPGLSYKLGNEVFHNPDRPFLADLNAVPFPDLSLIEGVERLKIMPVATSRGCPYGCRFCSVIQMFGRKYRYRDVGAVVDTIEEYNPQYLFFYDDNFAADPDRSKELLREMIRRNLSVQWSAQVRLEVADDPELLDLITKAGGRILHIGFESVNPATLAEYNKQLDIGTMADRVRAIKKHGLRIHGMFVVGSNSDDIHTPRQTVDFALRHHLDTIQLTFLVPLPGTPYFDDLEREGRLISRDWQNFDGHHVVYEPARMSAYELQYHVMKEMARFYSLRFSLNLLAKFDFSNLYYRLYGWRSIHKWLHDARNKAYMHFLKQTCS